MPGSHFDLHAGRFDIDEAPTGTALPPPFHDPQDALAKHHAALDVLAPDAGTMVVLPSLTVSTDELGNVTGIQHYEERLLFFVLALRQPGLQLVYLSSTPIDQAIVDYYLRLLPDPVSARERLVLVDLDDSRPLTLTDKLLEHPKVIDQLHALAPDPTSAWILPFAVTGREQAVAHRLGLPILGPSPELACLGSKSGSRRVARHAGVRVADGFEDLRSLEELEHAVARLRRRIAPETRVVVKLNDSYSGLGNAIVDLGATGAPITDGPTTFSAEGESWSTFARKIAARGAVVEELITAPGLRTPSVLVQITPGRQIGVLATHDQLMGGPGGQRYLGCRFPAEGDYREAIQGTAEKVAEVLRRWGVVGLFGIDFLVVPGGGAGHEVLASEINLRLGGTTHPLGTALLATGGSYDRATGRLMAGGRDKSYVATDNLVSRRIEGLAPAELIALVDRLGLAFQPDTGIGVVLHMLGAVPRFGKVGLTCIGDSPEAAADLYGRALRGLAGDAPAGAG
jgi:PGM1 C-terminal domain/ATP-grasp domain